VLIGLSNKAQCCRVLALQATSCWGRAQSSSFPAGAPAAAGRTASVCLLPNFTLHTEPHPSTLKDSSNLYKQVPSKTKPRQAVQTKYAPAPAASLHRHGNHQLASASSSAAPRITQWSGPAAPDRRSTLPM
jgi:hypothetical protein